MRIISALVCIYALIIRGLQTYRRAGNPIYPAQIIGFKNNRFNAQDNWGNMQVRYILDNQEIEAITIESTRLTADNLKKMQGKRIEVYVSAKNPYIVSVKGNHCLDFPCLVLFLIGLWGLLVY